MFCVLRGRTPICKWNSFSSLTATRKRQGSRRAGKAGDRTDPNGSHLFVVWHFPSLLLFLNNSLQNQIDYSWIMTSFCLFSLRTGPAASAVSRNLEATILYIAPMKELLQVFPEYMRPRILAVSGTKLWKLYFSTFYRMSSILWMQL